MGLIEFGVFCLVVCGVAFAINYFLPYVHAPAIVGTLVWGVAVFIILVVLARAVGLQDIMIPRMR